jgi:hypothetical protein
MNNLTREQIEELRTLHGLNLAVHAEPFNALCDMALQLAEARKDAERFSKVIESVLDIGNGEFVVCPNETEMDTDADREGSRAAFIAAIRNLKEKP